MTNIDFSETPHMNRIFLKSHVITFTKIVDWMRRTSDQRIKQNKTTVKIVSFDQVFFFEISMESGNEKSTWVATKP